MADEVVPQAVPGAALPRTTTVTTANPTPPTNVEVQYQGTPPSLPGLVPLAPLLTPDVSAGNFHLFKDPLNGAVKTGSTAPTELAGKAEGDGSETIKRNDELITGSVNHGRVTMRGVGPGTFTETPNGSHPSYGT